jgi:hypothetical protein
MSAELKKGVHWVGIVDWGIRHFHGYELSTHRGTTYNAYLIADDKELRSWYITPWRSRPWAHSSNSQSISSRSVRVVEIARS